MPLHIVGFSEHLKRNTRDRQAKRSTNIFIRHWKEHEKYATIKNLRFLIKEEKRRKLADSEALTVVLELHLIKFAEGKFGMLAIALDIFKVGKSVLLGFSDKKSQILLDSILCCPIEKATNDFFLVKFSKNTKVQI